MNNKNILFLTDAWKGKMTANAGCTQNVAQKLLQDGYRVFVSAFSRGEDIEVFDAYGVTVQTLLPPHPRRLYYKAEQTADPTVAKKLEKQANFYSKITRLRYMWRMPHLNPTFSRQWANQAEKIMAENDIGVVITVSAPSESMLAGYYLKKHFPSAKWFIYLIDNGSHVEKGENGYYIKKKLEKHQMKQILPVFAKADRIFIMEGHRKHYELPFFSSIREKITYLNVPLLCMEEQAKTTDGSIKLSFTPEVENWVYIGNLDERYYNPYGLCDFFKAYAKTKPAKLTFFGRGSGGVDTVRKFQQETNGTISFGGLIDHSEVTTVYQCCDVLAFYMTEDLQGSISGKFFEYLAAQKPIVYIANSEQDVNLQNVRKAPNTLCLFKEMSNEEKIKKTTYFLQNQPKLTMQEIETIFYLNTPRASARAIEEAVENKPNTVGK